MGKNILLFFLFGIICISCKNTTGLEPVSGVGGKLSFSGTWDAEIQAAAMIALDDLDLDNPASRLITYSNIIEPGTTDAEFFIQLLPGTYYLATVGITVDPGFFAAKLDSILESDEIPLKIIDNDLRNLTTPINIYSQQITNENREIAF